MGGILKKRIALAFALLTVTCVAALIWLAYVNSEKALRTSILRESAAALTQTGLQIDLTLENTKQDVLFLAGTPPMRGIQRARRAGGYDAEAHSTYDMWVERLQEIMNSLLRNKPDYWQARYIDEHGQERVRVDSQNGKTAAVPKRALQNKAEYAYFAEAMKLAPGAIYVSPLNLNREHGQIEVPHRPTLRVATPIVDVLGKRQGIVIINLHAESLLDSIHGPIQALGGRTYVVDQDGFFLSHPDPGKTFGFDLGFDYRLRNSHPRLAEKLADRKQFVEYVDSEGQQDVEPHIHGFRKVAYDPLDPHRYWAVILELPASIAFAPVHALRRNLLGLGAIIAALGAFLGMIWARRFARQAEVLTATAGEIARGRTDLRVDLNPMVDEFRTLGESLNHMVESLLASEARSTNIVNYASDAIVTTDEDQRIRGFNRGAERIFGYTATVAIGQPLDILIPEARTDAHRQHMRDFAVEPELARAMGKNRLIAGRRKDGSEFPAEANVSKLREDGHWVFTVFLRDVTERKRAEQALQEKEALLSTVGTMAKVGGWEFDARTLKGTWTDEVARIHDLDPKDETSVDKGLTFFVGESRKIIDAAVKEATEHGTPYDLELEMITAQGNHKWVRTIGQPVEEGGTVVKVRGSFQDITERKHDEEEIHRLNAELERKVVERTAELEAANRELEAFSYSVSHDLRAPLRSIDGFSLALLEDYTGKLDSQGEDYLRRVRAATQRMALLIDDMLTLSRVTRVAMRRETVDLSAIAETIVAELCKGEPARRVEIVIEPGLTARGDAALLRVALDNLLGNSWKFTARTEQARIEFGATLDNPGRQTFYVRDNGAGFDMAFAGKLFGAFQRLHSPHEFPGTGVGLATVQRIVHRHRGSIRAEGAVAKGATFYFNLPADTDDGNNKNNPETSHDA